MADLFPESSQKPVVILGDSLETLAAFPDASIDVIITSPPYFGQRAILDGPFRFAKTLEEYLEVLSDYGAEFKRILKPTGSLWLNVGDAYRGGNLLLVPSRIAILYQDKLGFTLRNDIIWEKRKFLPPSVKNRTSNSYEHFFHFVKPPYIRFFEAHGLFPRIPHCKHCESVPCQQVTGPFLILRVRVE